MLLIDAGFDYLVLDGDKNLPSQNRYSLQKAAVGRILHPFVIPVVSLRIFYEGFLFSWYSDLVLLLHYYHYSGLGSVVGIENGYRMVRRSNPSGGKIFHTCPLVFCFWNHFLTADFTSSSKLKCWPFKCSLSFGNRWKSLWARSGLYSGCGSMEKSRCWIASLIAALAWGLASCWRSVSYLIPIHSILRFNAVRVLM